MALRLPLHYILASLLVLLVGSSAFLDDLLEGRALRGPDFLLGALLALTSGVLLIALARATRSQVRHRALAERRREDMRALGNLGGEEGATALLESIAQHACETLAVDRAVITVHHPEDPGAAVVAAAAGPGVPEAGTRIATYHGVTHEALKRREAFAVGPHAEDAHILGVDRLTDGASSAAVAPLRWDGRIQGVLVVSRLSEDRVLGGGDMARVQELSEVCALGLEQTELRRRAERTLDAYVEAFSRALDARDSYTASHSEMVVDLALTIGKRLGLADRDLTVLEHTARLHDIGKLSVPDAILHKPGPLDEGEWRVMREHPIWGSRLLAGINGLSPVARAVRSEHEHWDGSGYPDGLAGNAIPLISRIVLACDAYHAMTSERPYQSAKSADEAINELREHAGSQFDPMAVDALISELAGRAQPATR